jgi:hypothetical protein
MRIRSPLTVLVWETVDQVPIAGVLLLPKTKPDRPFDGRISDERCCPSHLDDLLMKGEGGKPVEWL